MSVKTRAPYEGLLAVELTSARVRRLMKFSQLRVATLAGTSVGTVRVFELDPFAIADEQKRIDLEEVYAGLRRALLQSAA